ncbi:NAD(P)H-dependent oxidoreductase [Streptococcus iniae]|nr:NADPH-dependent FMN reductase [Streptococcus iniae]RLV28454.1 NAD(P)H-dependent oxidoreductase [Streptococcus iniae]
MSLLAILKGLFKGEKDMKTVLFIDGSLRKGSFNHQLALEAEKALVGKANVSYLDWAQVPVFSQDLEANAPESVVKMREAILAADAIWIFSPVYNFSIPGSVKNLLDWASRALDLSDTTGQSAIGGKITTVSSVANGGHDQLFAIYNDLLPFIRTSVAGDFTKATVNPEAWGTGVLDISDDTKESLKAQAEAVLAAIEG